MEGGKPHHIQTANPGVIRHTPPRSCSTPTLGSNQLPVIVRNHSQPSTPVSLDWDTSCLQDPFHAGAQLLTVTVPGIQRRRQSSTNPDIVDNDQILIVETDVSSLDSTLEKLVQGAGHLPSSVIPSAMEEEADIIFAEVDSVTAKMGGNPVSSLRGGNLDQYLVRLESLIDDVESCLRLFNAWRRKYRNDPNADLRNEVESELKNMEDTFAAYRNTIAEKKESIQERPPPPAVSGPTGGHPDQLLRHLQAEQRNNADLQLNTQKALIQGAMKQLETEIAVANWKIAEDDEVKEAMRQMDGWKTRKLEIGKNFLSYKA